ncbi:hypothetical protein [Streptomyces venezuelae]|uniref:hypothetical protein n=1 Tax=Streptomyces venezuelae TaxID=54571 RepID=UPI0033271231
MAARLHAQVQRIPSRLRLWSVGMSGTAYFACGMAVAVFQSPLELRVGLFAGWLLFLVAFVVLGHEATSQLPQETRDRWIALRNAASAVLYLALAVSAGGLLCFDRAGGMVLPAVVALANYFLSGGGDGELIPLAKLRTRISLKVNFRIIAVVSAALTLVLFLSHLRPGADQQNANFTFAAGVYVAAAGAAQKVHSRSRKLCTQINTQARSLIRALDGLAEATPGQEAVHVDKARHEWHQLRQLLHNRIETGLPLHGTPLLPASNRRHLEGKVNMALADTPRGLLFLSQARADLELLAAACAPRIDTAV